MSDAKDQPDAPAPKPGGFGAFSQKYRDRWNADHPTSPRVEAGGGTPAASMPPAAPTAPDSAADAAAVEPPPATPDAQP